MKIKYFALIIFLILVIIIVLTFLSKKVINVWINQDIKVTDHIKSIKDKNENTILKKSISQEQYQAILAEVYSNYNEPDPTRLSSKLTKEQALEKAAEFLKRINIKPNLEVLSTSNYSSKFRKYGIPLASIDAELYHFNNDKGIEDDSTNDETQVEINLRTGLVHYFRTFANKPQKTKTSIEEALRLALKIALENQINLKNPEFEFPQIGTGGYYNYPGYSFTWKRIDLDEGTKKELPDNLEITIDQYGQVINFSHEYLPLEISLLPKFTQAQAKEVTNRDYKNYGTLAKKEMRFESSDLLIETDPINDDDAQQVLVWKIVYGEIDANDSIFSMPLSKNLAMLTYYIDANDGTIIEKVEGTAPMILPERNF